MTDRDLIISKVLDFTIQDAGHAICIGIETADGQRMEFGCGEQVLPNLIQALIQAQAAALAHLQLAPRQALNLVLVYTAKDCRTGRSPDGQVAMQFPTTQGVPVAIAMTETLARTTIRRLTAEVEKSPPDPKTN